MLPTIDRIGINRLPDLPHARRFNRIRWASDMLNTGHICMNKIANLANRLWITFNQILTYITEQQDETKPILNDFLVKYVAVVLKKRLFLSTKVLSIHNSYNYCYECKVIGSRNTTLVDNAIYDSRCIARMLSSMNPNSVKKLFVKWR